MEEEWMKCCPWNAGHRGFANEMRYVAAEHFAI